ncbi:MAG: tetratricopeptide repeat protein [Kiritimatiellae bacterium]|nr:tetratricopeptide repeat protein [Kiritimatiellia bacterium]
MRSALSIFLLLPALALAACSRTTPSRLLARAESAASRGELALARDLLREALDGASLAEGGTAAWKDAPRAYGTLALASRALGATDDAREAFEQAAALAPDDFTATFNLGAFLLETGDVQRALRTLRRAADLAPADPRALLLLGDWATRNGRWDLARRMYFEAQKRSERCAAAFVGLGRLSQLADKPADAENYYMKALEIDPSSPSALYNLGVLFTASPDADKAAQGKTCLTRYRTLHAEAPRAAAAARRLEGESIPQTSFASNAPPAKPRTAAREWAAVAPAMERGDREAALASALSALSLARGGDNAQSEELVRRALATFPDTPAVLLEAGLYFASRGDDASLAQARDALLRAQTLSPNDSMVLFELSQVATALGEYDVAVLTLKRLSQLEPGNPDALWALAETYADKLGMTARAVAVFTDFANRFATDARAASVPGRILALNEDAANMPEEESEE